MPRTLGKARKTLGKGFAECNTQQTTLGKLFNGKPCLPSVFYRTLGSERVTGVPSNIIGDVVLWKRIIVPLTLLYEFNLSSEFRLE